MYDEVAPYAELVDARHPDSVTFFELLTAMAFAAFADSPVDVAVVEVGLGGTLGRHQPWSTRRSRSSPRSGWTTSGILGDTVEEIAAEKAGIIHAGATVVSAPQSARGRRGPAPPGPPRSGASIVREGIDFGVQSRDRRDRRPAARPSGAWPGPTTRSSCRCTASTRPATRPCALAAVEAFLGNGREPLDVDAVRAAFAAVSSPGRLEVVRRSPTVLLDGAHNPAGAAALAAALGDAFAFETGSSPWSPCSPTRTPPGCSPSWSRWSTASS